MTKFDELAAFLRAHLSELSWEGGFGMNLEFPDFDLTAFDYLDFAEAALAQDGEAARINCIAHLKRAAECQLDTFLHVMNIRPKGKRLSFPSKLEMIRPFGVLSPRSLAKLNRNRNRLEHEYASPEETDLELYFELVSAFVHAVEGFILMLKTHAEMEFVAEADSSRVVLIVECATREPCLRFDCRRVQGDSAPIEFRPEDGEGWGRAVRTFFLLCRYADLVSADFVLARLDAVPSIPSIAAEQEDDA